MRPRRRAGNITSEPEGRGNAWTEERRRSDEGRHWLVAPRRRAGNTALTVVPVAALGLAAVAWAAVPMSGAHPGAKPVLVIAAFCAVLAVVRLVAAVLARRPGLVPRDPGYLPAAVGFAARAWSGLLAFQWAESLTVAVLALEALHRPRPWHTVVLGVIVLAFLLALHLVESSAGPAVLRPLLPLIVAGLALAALSAGAAMLAGGGSLLAVIAAAAAVAVAVLALPV